MAKGLRGKKKMNNFLFHFCFVLFCFVLFFFWNKVISGFLETSIDLQIIFSMYHVNY